MEGSVLSRELIFVNFSRPLRVALLRRGEVGDVPGPGQQGGHPVHPPPRVLPGSAQPPGGRPQGGKSSALLSSTKLY